MVEEALATDPPALLADLGPSDPGGARSFDPSGSEMRVGDSLEILPTIESASIDFVATDPPYNVQLPMTMAGGKLAETFSNRRTDYAMVSDDAADLANLPDYPAFLDRMTDVLREIERVLRPGRYAVLIVRDAYQGGRYIFTGADLAARGRPSASSRRATSSGTRPGRGCARMAIRRASCRTSRTSTCWSCGRAS